MRAPRLTVVGSINLDLVALNGEFVGSVCLRIDDRFELDGGLRFVVDRRADPTQR